jgi:hypothetical protein
MIDIKTFYQNTAMLLFSDDRDVSSPLLDPKKQKEGERKA